MRLRDLRRFTLPSYKTVVLSDNPVAFWPLNETSGTTAYDISGNSYNGTYSGGFTLGQPGLPSGGTAVQFNGSSGCINIPEAVTTAKASVTLEGWVNLSPWGNSSTAGHGVLIKVGESGSVGSYTGYAVGLGANVTNNIFDNAGNYLAGLYSGNSWNPLNTPTQVPLSGWHHIVMVIESNSESSYYLDGNLVGTSSNSIITAPSSNSTIAGDDGVSTRYLLGILCNVAVYNTALSASQIQAHYNAGVS